MFAQVGTEGFCIIETQEDSAVSIKLEGPSQRSKQARGGGGNGVGAGRVY